MSEPENQYQQVLAAARQAAQTKALATQASRAERRQQEFDEMVAKIPYRERLEMQKQGQL